MGSKPGGKLTGENKQEKTKQEEGKRMTGIIVTGHGTFPEGILSAVSLVAGNRTTRKRLTLRWDKVQRI